MTFDIRVYDSTYIGRICRADDEGRYHADIKRFRIKRFRTGDLVYNSNYDNSMGVVISVSFHDDFPDTVTVLWTLLK